MKTLLLSSLLIAILLTTNLVWADFAPSTSLKVEVLQWSIYSHKANDGTTVVSGEIQNDDLNSPVNTVTIGVTFMDDNFHQIEYKTGTTLLQVIPAGGKSPFMISSTNPNPSITQIQVKIAGFQSSSEKQQMLNIVPGTLLVSDKIILSGIIKNNGIQKSVNTKLYLISYDSLSRVIETGVSDPITIGAGQDANFTMTSTSNYKSTSYVIIAESDNYQSKLINVINIQIPLPIVLDHTVVTDPQGNEYSTIPVNSSVMITSNARHLTQATQPFVYYVQVKQFDGRSAFIGNAAGSFFGGGEQNVTATWIPHSAGSYFIETYVWNHDNVPLSKFEPKINVVLVK
jgi:hypothetical protein